MRPKSLALILAPALLTAGLAYFYFFGGDEERRETVARSGSEVMPFDLEETTRVFKPTSTGGVQTVIANDLTDERKIELVQQLLRGEVRAFQRGDLSDPAFILEDDMPGLEELPDGLDALDVSYRDLKAGGQISYRTPAPELIAVLHAWFEAQTNDQTK